MPLFPKRAVDIVALAGIPLGPTSKVIVVDPVNGSASNDGLSFKTPLAGLEAAFALVTANKNDTIILVGGATGITLADTIAWNKSYTHLVGLSSNVPGVGQRCRVVAGSGTDETQCMTVSANGCIFRNIQFFNGNDTAALAKAITITGSRNEFTNCYFAGMGHATSAGFAGGQSVAISGAENVFYDCTLGCETMCRTAATDEVYLSGECNRNKFIRCEFVSWSNQATASLVKFHTDAVPYTTTFRDCAFHNFCSNNGATGTAMNHAIIDGASPYHQNLLIGSTLVTGCAAIVDVATYTFGAGPQPNAGMFIGAVTTT